MVSAKPKLPGVSASLFLFSFFYFPFLSSLCVPYLTIVHCLFFLYTRKGILVASSPCGVIKGFMESFGSESLTQALIFVGKLCPTKELVPGE
jgi:hypothetical protein